MTHPARLTRAVAGLLLCVYGACATGCASGRMIDLSQLAEEAGIAETVVAGQPFRHRLFSNEGGATPGTAQPLLIYLEGDGRPWIGGQRPSLDPTPRQPLAFALFLRTSHAAWYITRPCYHGLQDPGCSAELWTGARYSAAVADSLAAALRDALRRAADPEVVLVGYSGGGVLATLLATRLPKVSGVLTIAANLDVAAWAAWHRYLPLEGSLDPARLPATAAPHLTLAGGRDANVPRQSIIGYLEAHPSTMVRSYAHYDHVCCWQRDWESILAGALQQLGVLSGAAPQPAGAP